MTSGNDAATKKHFRQQGAAKAMSEHAIEQRRFGDNRERLKAERLTREAKALAVKHDAPITPKKKSANKQPATTSKGQKAK